MAPLVAGIVLVISGRPEGAGPGIQTQGTICFWSPDSLAVARAPE